MIFTATSLPGAFLIDVTPAHDERGFFARTVCSEEYAKLGLSTAFVQQSISWNPCCGTLRGLHFQVGPNEEDKLIRVTQGAIFDVIVDMRQGSATYGQWYGVELSAQNRRQIYVPRGMAHGFQTLMADTEVFYQMTASFHASASRGIRWNDPDLAIKWPEMPPALISEKDQNLPLLKDLR